jgi:hypothetical protein
MRPSERRGWRPIASLALLIALLAAIRFLGVALTAFLIIALGSVIPTTLWFFKGIVVPLTIGDRCPGCGGRLRYVGCISFGDRFYQCPDCGLRCKRGDVLDPWKDASGAGDEPVYLPAAKGGRSPLSGWFPDRRDAARVARTAAAFLAIIGIQLVCVDIGLRLSPAWGPTLGAGVAIAFVIVIGRTIVGDSSPQSDPFWDDDLDAEGCLVRGRATDWRGHDEWFDGERFPSGRDSP